MILIENKLEMFENVVYKNRVLEFEKIKAKWEEESKNAKLDKENYLKNQEEEIIARRRKLAKELGNEKIAKAKEEKRVLELRKMNELEDDLINEIRHRVEKWTMGDEYPQRLFEKIRESFSNLESGSYKIGLTQRDMDKYFTKIQEMAKEKEINLIPRIMPDSIIGGHIITDMEESYNLNNDLYNLIEDRRYEIGKLLYDLLRRKFINE